MMNMTKFTAKHLKILNPAFFLNVCASAYILFSIFASY